MFTGFLLGFFFAFFAYFHENRIMDDHVLLSFHVSVSMFAVLVSI